MRRYSAFAIAREAARPALDLKIDRDGADVVIVGGGYTGLSAALHLAAAGRECALLEAEDIGHGGAGRNVM